MVLVRELAPLFATAAGGLLGHAISPDGMGAYVGACIGIVSEVVISHLPPVMMATLD